jgi:glycosyltransferase involved in cell wall biosynthesis
MTTAAETLVDNAGWAPASPTLSVLIPFYRDDPRRLLDALNRQADGGVEVVLLDDGGVEPALSADVAAHVLTLSIPLRLISLSANEGRSKGRNRLARHARAQSLLFLDADMLPDDGNLHRPLARRSARGRARGLRRLHRPPQPGERRHRASPPAV